MARRPVLATARLAACVLAALPAVAATPAQASPAADELAVLVNESDPLSRSIAEYYVRSRRVPAQNLIPVQIDPSRASMTRVEFASLREAILRHTPPGVQFYALTWLQPYRVDCMSITSALAFGFDAAYCSRGCERTRLSPYFGSSSRRPWDDFRMRPTMSIAAESLPQARALIDRGVAADGSRPRGTAYLVRSGDAARDVRSAGYADASRLAGDRVEVRIEDTRGLRQRDDVLFYFTGGATVPDVATNRYLPGAVADHLTSAGGVLVGGEQMSSLRWLEAGATGSYGTVTEPCNYPGKFPNPGLMMQRYLGGETLVEAYWKSVAMPGQGIFIGEPLARPFGGSARP
jgi:uncharacterized protein (TIGR03790 family)